MNTIPRESGALPAAGPAVTGQGDYTPEELVMREAYWREQMADALYPSDDMHYGSPRAADLKARGAGAGGSAPYL